MTVASAQDKITYLGNGSTTVFPFSFSTPAVNTDIQVIYVDPTGITTVLAPTAYSLAFNPPAFPNPTPVGGQVTYNPGSPIPTGSTLTIARVLPLVQGTTLSNQQAFFQQSIEIALDYNMMAMQQIQDVQSRALVVPVTDPAPNPLPSATARANLVLGFDSNGNPIAVTTVLSGGSISSAMAPVCAAATLLTARTNMGMGNVAVENIGAGLEDDGAGNLIPSKGLIPPGGPGSPINITKAMNEQTIWYAAAIGANINLSQSNTYFAGFGFNVQNLSGSGTLSVNVNAADSFFGMATGQALHIPTGSSVRIYTDALGAWYVLWLGRFPGYGPCDNYSLSASVASGALTISLKDAAGNTPSGASPAVVPFGLFGGGGFFQQVLRTATNITVPSGATLGTQNGVPARVWVGMESNGVLAVYVSVLQSAPGVPTSIVPWDEAAQLVNIPQISTGSTSAQQWYGANGPNTSSVRILGYIEATEPTAGNWSVAPTIIQLFAQGNKKPGDMVGIVRGPTSFAPITSGTTVATGSQLTLSLSSKCNVLRIENKGEAIFNATGAGANAFMSLARGNTNNVGLIGSISPITSVLNGTTDGVYDCLAYDLPGVTSQVYSLQANQSGTNVSGSGGEFSATEIYV